MIRQCAWCKEIMGENQEGAPGQITHGICLSCKAQIKTKSSAQELKEFLKNFPFPVLLIQDEGVVKSANSVAKQSLNKDDKQIENKLCGRVFECRNSYLPEGCGKTEHCPGCELRNTVMDTMRTGMPYNEQDVVLNGVSGKFVVKISTEKVNEMVLLRVH